MQLIHSWKVIHSLKIRIKLITKIFLLKRCIPCSVEYLEYKIFLSIAELFGEPRIPDLINTKQGK